MPNPTTNFGWTEPVVGGDDNAWGPILNTLFDAIDSDLNDVKTTAEAALPKAGGVMSGRIDTQVATMKRQAVAAVGGTLTLDLSVAQYFTFTISGATTIEITNIPAGALVTGIICKITNGSAAAVTWPATVEWPGGVAPTLTAVGHDLVVLITDDNGASWQAVVAGADFS